MRKINLIVFHCSATLEGKPFTVKDIRQMHVRQGWSDIGYHWVIELDGSIRRGRPEEIAGSHVKGHNANSIGVCYIGGIGANGKGKDTRTPEQKKAMSKLLDELLARYPGSKVTGHRDLSPDKDGDGVVERHEWLKECPCFDVAEWLRDR